ncbi:Predicted amidohydrolase [Peptoclostridium litorale DSM 5388]|uniref:Hydrolase n=1 Tax=Peptoclostridium litorale DSM 5388 TaxID=1121324 RepID=A0A069RC12_PEPLI|nr:carbon-nitrogen hydrolase family protein [Peptoclostridium litorale]KDR93795.1 hydrolase [Peptoclostridium litorale DSM 5388]SIN86005.1 Predicted amidohydrolase [Peptoclostridium litorale DSM 5388]
MAKINMALCQMSVEEGKELNIKEAESLIREAASNGIDMAVLPEMFNCPYDNKYFPEYAEGYPGQTTMAISNLAKELGIYIVAGSIPEKDGDSIYNTCYVFGRDGECIGKHRKMHLFDIDVKGRITFKESDVLGSGDQCTVFETEFCNIGVAICYDMRFPELMRLMAVKGGAKVIIVPAAFNMTTGPAHWSTTCKTRALDNQVYFIAVSPARNIKSSYTAYGHSIIADPWGNIIMEADEKEDILYGEIDLEMVEKVRQELPLLQHRRRDVYSLNYKHDGMEY